MGFRIPPRQNSVWWSLQTVWNTAAELPTLQLQHPVQLDLPTVFAARLKIVESVLLGVTGWKPGLPVVLQPVKNCFFVLRAGIAAESMYLWDDWWLSRCTTAKILPSCFFLHLQVTFANLLLYSPFWFRFCSLHAVILYDLKKKKKRILEKAQIAKECGQ